jgi:hypothetical protein
MADVNLSLTVSPRQHAGFTPPSTLIFSDRPVEVVLIEMLE